MAGASVTTLEPQVLHYVPDSALRLGHTREALHLYLTLIIHKDRHQRIWRAGPQEDNTKRRALSDGRAGGREKGSLAPDDKE